MPYDFSSVVAEESLALTLKGYYIDSTTKIKVTVSAGLTSGNVIEKSPNDILKLSEVEAKVATGKTAIEWKVGEAVYDFSAKVVRDFTITATLAAKVKTTFDWKDFSGLGTSTPTTTEVQTGEDGKVPSDKVPDLYRLGYTFDGWYRDNDLVTEFSMKEALGVDTTLYAKWINGYTITVDYSFDGKTESLQTSECGLLSSFSSTVTRPGHRLLGFYEKVEGKEVDIDLVKHTFLKATTIYARWKKIDTTKTHTVTYRVDGKTYTESVYDGDSVSEPSEILPKKKGHNADGWYLDEKFQEKYDNNLPVTADMTLYGRYVKRTDIMVAFHNGYDGYVENSNQNQYTYEQIIPVPADPTRTDSKYTFTFIGWYPAIEGKTIVVEDDITYYAQWRCESSMIETAESSVQAEDIIKKMSNVEVPKGEKKVVTLAATEETMTFKNQITVSSSMTIAGESGAKKTSIEINNNKNTQNFLEVQRGELTVKSLEVAVRSGSFITTKDEGKAIIESVSFKLPETKEDEDPIVLASPIISLSTAATLTTCTFTSISSKRSLVECTYSSESTSRSNAESAIVLDGCKFTDVNSKSNYGGAVGYDGSEAGESYKLNIKNSVFKNCVLNPEEFETMGGAIFAYASSPKQLEFSDVKFEGDNWKATYGKYFALVTTGWELDEFDWSSITGGSYEEGYFMGAKATSAFRLGKGTTYAGLEFQEPPEGGKNKLSTGAIIGIVIGCVAFVAIIVAVIVIICCCRKKKAPKSSDTEKGTEKEVEMQSN